MVVGGSAPNPGLLAVRRIPTLIIWPFSRLSIESRLLQWMPLEPASRLFDDYLAFHVVMAGAAGDAAIHGKYPRLVGLEFDLGGLTFFYRLVDLKSIDVEA